MPNSFLGLMIAINTSIVFRRVRLWLFSKIYSFVKVRANECYKRIHGEITDEKEIDALIQIVTLILNGLRRRLGRLTTFGVVSCAAMAIFGGALYWLGVPESGNRYLYLFALPVIAYFTATMVCCGCALDSCRGIFDEYERCVFWKKSNHEAEADVAVRKKFDNAIKRFAEFTMEKKGASK